MTKKRVLIMGAAGRDFHNFNVVYRDNPDYHVAAFTATQIPNIEGRLYPPELAGPRYPQGIPIRPETELTACIQRDHIDTVVFSYSDVSHEFVLQRASHVLAAGANFELLAPQRTWIPLDRPVIAVTAIRTGCGKSQTARKIVQLLTAAGRRVVAVRHPMPYGDLRKQICMRFASHADLDLHHCTIEEREEFEPYLEHGLVVYAGIDYARIATAASAEADVIIWDGGNNDTPFFKPDLHCTVLDPLRAGHESTFHPGHSNFLMGNVLIINKYRQATGEQLAALEAAIQRDNPAAAVIRAHSKIIVEHAEQVLGKKVLAIEDGPTVTHGGMGYGAGVVAARELGAAEVIDPRSFAVGSIKAAYTKYPQLGCVVPALGYYPEQLAELTATINAAPCDVVLVASPIDLTRVLTGINKPMLRVRYELDEIGTPDLQTVLAPYLRA